MSASSSASPAAPQLPLCLPNIPRATKEVNFADGIALVTQSTAAEGILGTLTATRKKINGILLTPPATTDIVANAADPTGEYISLLAGVVDAPEPTGPPPKDEKQQKKDAKKKKKEGGEGDAAEPEANPVHLSRAIGFAWSNFSAKAKTQQVGGVDVEISSTLLNLGLWQLMYAKGVLAAAGAELDAHQKEAYKLLCKTSGLFQHVASRVTDQAGDQSDLRANVPKALADLALAEGQTITIDRAITSAHSPNLISGLCRAASERFQAALDTLLSPNPTPNIEVHQQLVGYLTFKAAFYEAAAYHYQGVQLSQSDSAEVGKSLKSLQTAVEKLTAAEPQIAVFAKTGNNASAARAFYDFHFKQFDEALAKLKRQNETVFYDKLPDQPEPLPEAKSTIEVAEFTAPETSKKWNAEVYSSMRAKEDGVAAAEAGKAGCCSIM